MICVNSSVFFSGLSCLRRVMLCLHGATGAFTGMSRPHLVYFDGKKLRHIVNRHVSISECIPAQPERRGKSAPAFPPRKD